MSHHPEERRSQRQGFRASHLASLRLAPFSLRRLVVLRPFSASLLAPIAIMAALAASAAACEGTGGPPSSPPEKEKTCNASSPNLQYECVGKPVNNATGDETEQQTDISIGGRGPGLHIVRTYNAQVAAEGKESPFGYGWSAPYDTSLEVAGELVIIRQEDGSAIEFYKSGSEYTQGGWDQARLVKETSGNYVYTLPDQSKLEFNGEGKLIKETERDGNSNTLTYNASKQLEKVEDGDKRTLTFKYKEGLVESVTDPLKHVVSYTYKEKQLATVTIESKVRWEFEYGSSHLLTKVTDGRKHATTIKYESATPFRVTEEEYGKHTRKWKYGATPGTETTITEPNGSETLETFNSAGEPTKITRAKGKAEETTTEYEYEASTFARTKTIDGNKHETKYGYDAEGNKTSETDASGDERKWTYDKKHDVETETTPEGEETKYTLNSRGNPEKIERGIDGETEITEYKYDAKGDLEEVIDPLKHATKYTYDAAGDKEIETDPEGNERKWKYNEDSQETEETSPRGFTTITTRDEYGRPTKVEDPLKHTTEYKYDGNGNLESETDGNKHETKYEYNEENLRTKVVEPLSSTETEYDSEGQMTAHKDGNGHTWHYKRNALEQVTEEEDPLKHVTKKKYDKAGNLESKEDAEKHTTEYVYDKSNRLEKIKYSTSKPLEVTFEYTKDSRVKKMIDETGTTENTYDKLDRLTEYKNGAEKVVKYAYDLVNLPTKITYPGEKKEVTRAYDKNNRLEKVTDWKEHTTSFKYNKDSLLEATTFPSATENKDEYEYNKADQMSEVKMLKGATSLGNLVYERDGDGQVTKTTTKVLPGAEVSESKYDEDNRLTEANKLADEYDKANNPTKLEGSGTYSYDEASRLKEGPEAKYAYNEDDQRTKTEPKSGEPSTTYAYDQAGELTSVERAKGSVEPEIKESYVYDGNGLRETQTVGVATTHLTWDTAEPLPLVLTDETNYYIYGPEGLPVEQIATSGEAVLYLHHDQQGSTRLLTNSSGNTERAYTYNAYGTVNATTGSASTPLRYDGQYTSSQSGLIYLRARVYDPVTGQFLSVDPALEETGEAYVYVKDDPLNVGDLSGRCGEEPNGCEQGPGGQGEGKGAGGMGPGGQGEGKGKGSPKFLIIPIPFPPYFIIVPVPTPPGSGKGSKEPPKGEPKPGPLPGQQPGEGKPCVPDKIA